MLLAKPKGGGHVRRQRSGGARPGSEGPHVGGTLPAPSGLISSSTTVYSSEPGTLLP